MKKNIFVIILLVAAMAIAFALPKPKYQSINILSTLKLSETITGWQSRDFSDNVKSKMSDADVYNFIGDVFARVYRNFLGEELLMLILDAGNFHNPKVCYGSSGYRITELEDIELAAGVKNFKAHVLYMEKGNEGLVMVYWICIEKKIVGWTGQKILELWSSLVQKKKAGLMVRLDIPTRKGNTETPLERAKYFVRDLSRNLTAEQSEYLFGK